MRTFPAMLAVLGLGLLAQCGRVDETRAKGADRWELTAAPLLALWQDSEMIAPGQVLRDEDGFTLKAGEPMTGIFFPGWEQEGLPVTNYRITYEAMRVEGGDFFGTVTFPVGGTQRCVTFVLGGWGGSQVGISNIDGQDASQNSTGSSQKFENGRWYRIKIEVREKSLQVWYEDKPLVNLDLEGRELGLRPGEIDKCVPFGFAAYGTEGRMRRVVVERL